MQNTTSGKAKSRRNTDLPHSEEAERGVLACLLSDPSLLASREVGIQLFHDARHQLIFSEIEAMRAEELEPELETLAIRLSGSNKIEQAGGWQYVSGICDATPSALNVDYFLRIARDQQRRRELLTVINKARQTLGSNDTDVGELAGQLRETAGRIASDSGGGEPAFADLSAVLEGDLEPELPTVGKIQDGDGAALFYAGRLNAIHSEPGVGKSNLSLAVCAESLNAGDVAVYIDPEDTPKAAVRKLLAFGVERETIPSLFRYLHNPDPADLSKAVRWAKDSSPGLVCVDGLAELMAGSGMSEDKADDFLKFARLYLRPLSDAGHTVVVSDHVTKDSEGRGRWARGSGANLGRYDGAVYSVKEGEPYGPDKAGHVRLVLSKDRNGGVGRLHETIAEMHFKPVDEGTEVTTSHPKARDFRPTGLMAKVCRHLRDVDSQAGIKKIRTLGKAEYVEQALSELEAGGYIERHEGGPGRPTRFTLWKVYHPEDEENRGTVSRGCPEGVPDTGDYPG